MVGQLDGDPILLIPGADVLRQDTVDVSLFCVGVGDGLDVEPLGGEVDILEGFPSE